jgi:hypothetical protein
MEKQTLDVNSGLQGNARPKTTSFFRGFCVFHGQENRAE